MTSTGLVVRYPGLVFAALIAAMAMFGCSRSDLVATYANGRITRAQYDGYLKSVELLDSPSALRQMIVVEHFADLAIQMGVDQEAETKVELVVEAQRVLGDKLRNHVFLSATATDEEIKAYADQNPSAFVKPRKMRLRQIYLDGHGRANEARDKLERLRTAVLDGASFEELAMRESESQTRYSGGRLGFVDPAAFPETVAAALAPLGEGDVSEVVATGSGFSIFLCEKLREAAVPTRAEVEAKIRTNLLRQRGKAAWHAMIESLRSQVQFKFPLVLENGVYQLYDQTMTPAELEALKRLQMDQKGWDTMSPGQVHAVVQNWCLGRALANKARELGLDSEPETANLLYWQRRRTLAEKVMAGRIAARIQSPGKAEIEAFYQENRARLTTPPQYRMAAIFFGNQKEAIELATKVNQELEAGALTFAEAARRYSHHPSSQDGGLWDWMLIREIAAYGIDLSKSIRNMKPGQRTGVFRLETGIWIFELVDVKEGRELTLEEARIQVENALHRRALEAAEKAVREAALAELKVEIIHESEGS